MRVTDELAHEASQLARERESIDLSPDEAGKALSNLVMLLEGFSRWVSDSGVM